MALLAASKHARSNAVHASGRAALHNCPCSHITDGGMALKENAPTQVGEGPPAALPLIVGKVGPCPSKPLVEQFRLGNAPSFPKPAGIIAKGDHRASRCIFSSTNSRHHHHRRPQGKPQPSPCHHIPAFSPLPASGHGRCHNPHDAQNRCNRQAGHCAGQQGLMGVPLLLPAEMENQFLGFAAPF